MLGGGTCRAATSSAASGSAKDLRYTCVMRAFPGRPLLRGRSFRSARAATILGCRARSRWWNGSRWRAVAPRNSGATSSCDWPDTPYSDHPLVGGWSSRSARTSTKSPIGKSGGSGFRAAKTRVAFSDTKMRGQLCVLRALPSRPLVRGRSSRSARTSTNSRLGLTAGHTGSPPTDPWRPHRDSGNSCAAGFPGTHRTGAWRQSSW